MKRGPRDALLLGEIEQREQVAVDSVNAAVSEQSHEMERAAGLAHMSADVAEGSDHEERTVTDREIDADDVLHDNAAGTEVQMADFTVSHLPFRESNG